MIPYIINVALVLAGCLVFYKLLLRKETFYKMNRYMLMLCLVISFGLPLLPVPQQLSLRKADEVVVNNPVSITTEVLKKESEKSTVATQPRTQLVHPESPTIEKKISLSQVLLWMKYLYWFGVLVFGLNFLVQVCILLYRAYSRPVILDGRFRIVEISGNKAPCSFGNNIFINPEKYDWETYNQIIQHEKVHIRQGHTFDILLAELVLIFQWFNPFAWLYRKELENNLEFLTDDQLVYREEIEKSSYQMSLLKVSAPHFPLSLTTNYNQSLLKKRIAMMNSKKSSVHTAWKYLFLLPLLVLFACILNEPKAQTSTATNTERKERRGIDTEGSWFATIMGEKVSIQFKSDEDSDHESFNSSNFKLSELSNVPKGTAGTFKITREAGTMEFTGRFEGDQGMGRYKFVPNKEYGAEMGKEVNETLDDQDMLAFFFINITRDYVKMLHSAGYPKIEKDELIPLAALKVDAKFIQDLKSNGFNNLTLEELIPLKSLGINGDYIKEIRAAGYKNVTSEQLITFKAQGIDKAYIEKVRPSINKSNKDGDDDADDIVTYKALNIDDEFIKGFKKIGMTNIPHEDLVAYKSVGVTPEFIKGFHDAGFRDVNPSEFTSLKALDVTPQYIKSFESLGFKNTNLEDYTGLKALNVTPEYVKGFTSMGYKLNSIEDYVGLKSQNVTPEFIKSFEAIGFKDTPLDEFVAIKATGVTPEYITTMKAKGFNYTKLSKYITLKSIQDDED